MFCYNNVTCAINQRVAFFGDKLNNVVFEQLKSESFVLRHTLFFDSTLKTNNNHSEVIIVNNTYKKQCTLL